MEERGCACSWGPNQMVEPVITRTEPDTDRLQLLAIPNGSLPHVLRREQLALCWNSCLLCICTLIASSGPTTTSSSPHCRPAAHWLTASRADPTGATGDWNLPSGMAESSMAVPRMLRCGQPQQICPYFPHVSQPGHIWPSECPIMMVPGCKNDLPPLSCCPGTRSRRRRPRRLRAVRMLTLAGSSSARCSRRMLALSFTPVEAAPTHTRTPHWHGPLCHAKHDRCRRPGYIDDARNTDNAWVESRSVHYHCEPRLGRALELVSNGDLDEDDALQWLDLHEGDLVTLEKFQPRHRAFVLLAVSGHDVGE